MNDPKFIQISDAQHEIGDKVTAWTAYKYVPYAQYKYQVITINLFDGEVIGGKTEKGKQVYFTVKDIK